MVQKWSSHEIQHKTCHLSRVSFAVWNSAAVYNVCCRRQVLLMDGRDMYILVIPAVLLVVFFVLFNTLYISAKIKEDENLVFYRDYACTRGTKIHVNVHGQVYEPETGSFVRAKIIEELQDMLDLSPETPAYHILEKRIQPFLRDHERGKKISVTCGGSTLHMKPTGADGHFYGKLTLSRNRVEKALKGNSIYYHPLNPGTEDRDMHGRSVLVGEKGISVISDIDDTIKISNVLDTKELLKNTFTSEFRVVPGMAGLYAGWAGRGAAFHYVSGSPWQLYRFITDFLDENGFPPGSVHLKKFRLTDRSSIRFLVGDQLEYKKKRIQNIIKDFPGRQFILSGDSGEQDPEVYAAIAMEFPRRIKAILIRNAGNLQSSKRIDDLKKTTPGISWHVFSSGNDLADTIQL